ncbi:hypothetical protein DMA60_13055 [Salmonella enterica subsp. enterica]|nr:hypothetical protein [Salmonella enterica subsp. enterica]
MPHGPGVAGIRTGGGLKVATAPVGVVRADYYGTTIAPFASLGGRLDRCLATRGHLNTTRGDSGPLPELQAGVDTARRRWAIQ